MAAVKSGELAELTRRLAWQINPRLRVSGVLAADGNTDRTELLVAIEGCHADPCFLVLNVDRSERSAVERDLAGKLRVAIEAHLETR
jgi:hypothetical protein